MAAVVLTLGAVGPALLALGYPSGPVFTVGAILEAVAVVGFAGSYLWMFRRSDRNRVGLYGPLAGVLLGSLGVALGVFFAFVGLDAPLGVIHRRLNVFGLLGVSILGALYQFYPPAICPWPGGTDRTALATLALVASGLFLASWAPVFGPLAERLGHLLALAGAVGCSYLLAGTILSQSL